ncbi:transposase, MuDR, plant [Tanacetum coccineum]
MASSSSSSSYLIRFHRGGVFVRDHFSYDYEMLSEIPNVDMGAMNFVGFVNFCEVKYLSDDQTDLLSCLLVYRLDVFDFFDATSSSKQQVGNAEHNDDSDSDLDDVYVYDSESEENETLLVLESFILMYAEKDVCAEKDVSLEKDVSDEDNLGDQWPIHDPTIKWKLMRHVLGEKYESPEQLKRALVFYALANGYKLYYEVNNPRRLLAKCCRDDKDNKCPFRLWASWMQNEKTFQIKKLNDEHSCSRTFEYGTLITSNWIARNYAKKIMMNPCIKVKEIIESILKKYKCKVKISQARRGKMKALQQYETCLEDHYGMLWSYASEILNSNPGSTWLREGWLQGCRSVIGLDGCFLKTICKGELLSAVGRDGNNQIYPIAWAVGIIEAAKQVMPLAEHRQCARHIYDNFRKKYIGVQYMNLFWKVAKATYGLSLELGLRTLKNDEDLAKCVELGAQNDNVLDIYFSTDKACDAVENEISECFNTMIVDARRKPIINMLDDIRVLCMEGLQKMREKHAKWTDDICPNIRKKLEKHWNVIPSGESRFEVRNGYEGFKDVFVNAYNHYIEGMNEMDQWPTTDYQKPLPPTSVYTEGMPGRPPHKRKRDAMEDDGNRTRISRKGQLNHCTLCKKPGHNQRACPSKPEVTAADLIFCKWWECGLQRWCKGEQDEVTLNCKGWDCVGKFRAMCLQWVGKVTITLHSSVVRTCGHALSNLWKRCVGLDHLKKIRKVKAMQIMGVKVSKHPTAKDSQWQGFGVSWDSIDGQTMLGMRNSMGLPRHAWPEDRRNQGKKKNRHQDPRQHTTTKASQQLRQSKKHRNHRTKATTKKNLRGIAQIMFNKPPTPGPGLDPDDAISLE